MEELLSPAKINLGLEVHHRRISDGYHYISSIFIPISWGDSLTVRLETDPDFTNFSQNSNLLTTENLLNPPSFLDFEAVSERGDISKNILYKAILKIKEKTNANFRIHLKKQIPTGAGLGGGSSNAGVLLRYFGEKFSIEKDWLKGAAQSLGADVPFFLENKPSLVTGIGEICQPLPEFHGFGLLCFSKISVNTKKAYSELKRSLQDKPAPKMLFSLDADAQKALFASDWKGIKVLKNDFESVVFAEHPVLKELKDSLLQLGADYAAMSGSGSTIYGLTRSQEVAQRISQEMTQKYPDFNFVQFSF